MMTTKNAALTPTERKFIALAAEMAESFSFSGTLAKIYALLYIRKEAIPLGEIAVLLGMSKGNASVNIRILEGWGAVRKAWVPGTRQDHYEPIRDIKALALRRIEEGLSRRLNAAEERMNAVAASLDADSASDDKRFLKERLKSLQGDIAAAQKALRLLPKLDFLRGLL